jgi:sialic acid synthase SpsE
MIERHFRRDRNAGGPDHRLSFDPAEMTWLMDAIRSLEFMRGSGVKRLEASEAMTRLNNRKSVVPQHAVGARHGLLAGGLAIRRQGMPKLIDQVIGRSVPSAISPELRWENLA